MRTKIVSLAVVVGLLTLKSVEGQDRRVERSADSASSRVGGSGGSLKAGDVILQRSGIYILVGKTGFGHDHGVFGKLQSGQVLLGASQRAGSLVFDMANFDADSPAARKYVGLKGDTDERSRREVNANLYGRDVLDTARFPTATFTITSALPIRSSAERNTMQFELNGTLTLHGVTNPLKLVCDATPSTEGTRLTTSFVLVQSDYGIKPFSKAFGAVGVADPLRVWGDLIIANADQ